jgi:hypothetical protein
MRALNAVEYGIILVFVHSRQLDAVSPACLSHAKRCPEYYGCCCCGRYDHVSVTAIVLFRLVMGVAAAVIIEYVHATVMVLFRLDMDVAMYEHDLSSSNICQNTRVIIDWHSHI